MTPYPTKNFTATLDPDATNVTLVAHQIEMIKQEPPARPPPVEYPNRKTRRRNAALARKAKR